ncbi:adenylate/guanylate cyclase domain-containing protein [Arenicella sp. 4NH20-0111]|uniref:adenylate/guanylate cyclase domain-containing protein n=1 Tax=Arenicella sp. 4NH20-0111 TaxID=3127648 RepID=UPI0033416D6E
MLRTRFKKSLRWRIAILFSGLILVLLTTALLVVNQQNIKNAESNIESDLAVTAGVFQRLISNRTQSLQDIAKPATSDHAFRQVFGEGHTPTMVSAMNNLVSRISNVSTGTMLLIDFDGQVIASTNEKFNTGEPNPWPWMVERAENNDLLESSGTVLIDNRPYQLTVSPLLIPDPEAWVILGFAIDDEFAKEISQIALTDVSVYSSTDNQRPMLHASSLDEQIRASLFSDFTTKIRSLGRLIKHETRGENFLSLNFSLDKTPLTQIDVAIHGSLDKELVPYQQLSLALVVIFTLGLVFSAIGTFTISQSITEPIQQLNQSVSAIGDGDYGVRVGESREDEIGSLAKAVNIMAVGLEEKERVRNLLGKVVSNQVADELLNNDIELGGEEREASIMFSDIRNFTGLSETMPPADLLNLLNRYFNRITSVIEENNGIVDKYIGDAVMAVFGAPIRSEDHASHAVKSALGMVVALKEFNQELKEELGIELEIGIGISSGKAVAGNMGSESRMNYTLIGDTVNTASRLEGLTKEYDTPIIVSAHTATAASEYDWADLGLTSVKGKVKKIQIFTPSEMI